MLIGDRGFLCACYHAWSHNVCLLRVTRNIREDFNDNESSQLISLPYTDLCTDYQSQGSGYPSQGLGYPKGTCQPPSENLARPSTSLEMLRSNSIIVPSCWEFQQYINGVKMPARARGHLTQPEGHQRKANSPRDAR